MFGLKKNAKGAGPAAELFARCGEIYSAHRNLAYRGTCGGRALNLVSPDGAAVYELLVYDNPVRSYGLFPADGEGKAGRGSFVEPDGSFDQHGPITQDDAARILAACIPAPRRVTYADGGREYTVKKEITRSRQFGVSAAGKLVACFTVTGEPADFTEDSLVTLARYAVRENLR